MKVRRLLQASLRAFSVRPQPRPHRNQRHSGYRTPVKKTGEPCEYEVPAHASHQRVYQQTHAQPSRDARLTPPLRRHANAYAGKQVARARKVQKKRPRYVPVPPQRPVGSYAVCKAKQVLPLTATAASTATPRAEYSHPSSCKKQCEAASRKSVLPAARPAAFAAFKTAVVVRAVEGPVRIRAQTSAQRCRQALQVKKERQAAE